MTDNMTKKQRSKTMSRIRSIWTSKEKMLHNLLKSLKIKHKMHPQIVGNPDVLIYPKTLLFIDGCFWHGCPKHYKKPKSNVEYWEKKIRLNVNRDLKSRDLLKKRGWKVKRIWEHEIKKDTEKYLLKL